MKWIGIAAAIAYVGTVWAANYAIGHWGTPTPGGTHVITLFGLTAPSGVLFAGLAFSLRDVVQHNLGRLAVIVSILAGTALSLLIQANTSIPGGYVSIAVASGIAFLLSETADFGVYTPLRRQTWMGAVALSNIVGAAVDSALFLWLAFGSLAFFWGQFGLKSLMTVPAILVIAAFRGIPRRKVALA